MLSDTFRTIGIDIGGTAIKIAVVWSDGRVVESRQIPTDADAGPEAASGRILACVETLRREHELESREMRALGIDSAGIVDGANNLVLDAPNLRRWERYPLAERLGTALGLPAFLENDVNAMAYGEWQCGAGRGTRDLLCLTLGTGVGGGLVLDGKLYRGARGAAGEIGHMSIEADGPRCACGNWGCLERYVGAQFIVARAVEMLGGDARPSSLRSVAADTLSPRIISEAAAGGDVVAIDVLDVTGRWLGVALANLVNLLNPERIVVGGGVARAGDLLLGSARRTLRERAMNVPAQTAEVVTAALGNDAAVVGAALLAVARLESS
jgi:glucokinase